MNDVFGGYPSDDYQNFTPIKDIGDIGGARTIFEVPENKSISMGGIEFVREDEDIFKGKRYRWKDGPFAGTISRADKMMKKGSLYYVIFDTGQMLTTDEVLVQLQELTGGESDLNIRPNAYTENFDPLLPALNDRRRNRVSEAPAFDPVIEILKKKKKNYLTVSIDLELDIPPKELYTLLVDGYENGEDKIIEYLFTNDNVTGIKSGIKESIRKMYGIEVTNEDKE